MRFTSDNFLYLIKQLVTGKNGIVNRIGGAKAADGGFKLDNSVALNSIGTAAASQLTDNTGGTASTTVAAITAGAAYAQADMTAVKNGLASIIKQLNLLTFTSSETSALVISIPAATNAVITNGFSFPIPRDYDEASDTYIVRVTIAINSADVAVPIYLKGTPTIKHIGQAAVAGTAVYATIPFAATAGATTTAGASPLTATEAVYEIILNGNGLKRDDIVYVALALQGTTTQPALVYAVENTYDSTLVSYNETDTTGVDGSLTAYGNPLR